MREEVLVSSNEIYTVDELPNQNPDAIEGNFKMSKLRNSSLYVKVQ